MNTDTFVVISGCSGGGKSSLLAEFRRRGHPVVEEPGRRIVREEVNQGGSALPWVDGAAFARRAMAMAVADRFAVGEWSGWIFFDRSVVDAAAALQHVTGEPVLLWLGGTHRYHRRVFLAPPWPEIFVEDAERRHGWDAAQAEYGRLLDAYRALGYQVTVLPKASIAERADFVLERLDFPTANRQSNEPCLASGAPED